MYEKFKKLSAAEANTGSAVAAEKEFANAIKSLFDEYLKEKLSYLYGDGEVSLIDVDLDNNSVVGSYDIDLGETVVSIPLRYSVNKISDPVSMYIVKEKRLVTLSKEWYEFVRNMYSSQDNTADDGVAAPQGAASALYGYTNRDIDVINPMLNEDTSYKYAFLRSLTKYDLGRLVSAARADGRKYAMFGRQAIAVAAQKLTEPKDMVAHKVSYTVNKGYVWVDEKDFPRVDATNKTATLNDLILNGDAPLHANLHDWDSVAHKSHNDKFVMEQLETMLKTSGWTAKVSFGADSNPVMIVRLEDAPLSVSGSKLTEQANTSTYVDPIDDEYNYSYGRTHSIIRHVDTDAWVKHVIDTRKLPEKQMRMLEKSVTKEAVTNKEFYNVFEGKHKLLMCRMTSTGPEFRSAMVHFSSPDDEKEGLVEISLSDEQYLYGPENTFNSTMDYFTEVTDGNFVDHDGNFWAPVSLATDIDSSNIIIVDNTESMSEPSYNQLLKTIVSRCMSPRDLGINTINVSKSDADDTYAIKINEFDPTQEDIIMSRLTKRASMVFLANRYGTYEPEKFFGQTSYAMPVKNAAAADYMKDVDLNEVVETITGQKNLVDKVGAKGGVTINIENITINKPDTAQAEETVTEVPSDIPPLDELIGMLVQLGVPEDFVQRVITVAEQAGMPPEEAVVMVGEQVELDQQNGVPLEQTLANIDQTINAVPAPVSPEVQQATQPGAPDNTMLAAADQMVPQDMAPMPMPATDMAMAPGMEQAAPAMDVPYSEIVGHSAITDIVANAAVGSTLSNYIPVLNDAMNAISEMILKLDINKPSLVKDLGQTVVDEVSGNLRDIVKLIGETILKVVKFEA